MRMTSMRRLAQMLLILALAAMAVPAAKAIAQNANSQNKNAKAKSAQDKRKAKRDKIRKMANETLKQLYKLQPSSRAAIQKAGRYAVFDNMGVHVLLLSTARGGGIAVNSELRKETFMRMVSGGVGLGVGVKDYRVVFVFETQKAYNKFLDSGWDAGGQADAAAKTGSKGGAYSGAISAAEDVWVYQITKKGLALQLTLQGTKYYRDDNLNKK